MTQLPNPGSKEAVEMGCKCPVLDNNMGMGMYFNGKGEPEFWINGYCPLHARVETHLPPDPAESP